MEMQICRLMGLYAKSLGSCRRLLAARLLVSAALPRNPTIPTSVCRQTSNCNQPGSPTSEPIQPRSFSAKKAAPPHGEGLLKMGDMAARRWRETQVA